MIDLYYWPTPNGWKVSILLEELGIPYRPVMVNIGKGEQFTPSSWPSVPTTACRPSSTMTSTAIRCRCSSPGRIVLYLAQKHGRFLPAGPLGRKEMLEWLFWQVGNLGPMAGQYSHFVSYSPEGEAYSRRRYNNEYHRCLGVPGTTPGATGVRSRRRLHDRRHDLLAMGAHRQGHGTAARRVPEPDPLACRGEGAARGQTRRRSGQGVPAVGAAHRGRARGAVQPDRAHRRRAGIVTAARGAVVRRTQFRPHADTGVRADDTPRWIGGGSAVTKLVESNQRWRTGTSPYSTPSGSSSSRFAIYARSASSTASSIGGGS